jgi:hypothetical protein
MNMSQSDVCDLCNAEVGEDLEHVFFDCPVYDEIRLKFSLQASFYFSSLFQTSSSGRLDFGIRNKKHQEWPHVLCLGSGYRNPKMRQRISYYKRLLRLPNHRLCKQVYNKMINNNYIIWEL